MVDAEQLILAVEKQPCIWNTNIEEFHHKTMRDASWESLCADLIDDWTSLLASEKLVKMTSLKKRWANIRDYFRKAMVMERAVETRKCAKKHKQYVYFDILSFLRPIYDRQSICNDPLSEDKYQVIQELEAAEPAPSATRTSLPSSASSNKQPSGRRKRNHNKSIKFETILRALERKEASNPPEDADLLFLKSLLPDMKMLSDEKKLEFKMSTMKNLYDLRKSGNI